MSAEATGAADMVDVWVVEDNAFLRETLRELLDCPPHWSCSVAVPTCEQAIEALSNLRAPAVLLMDLGLPGMRGEEGIACITRLVPSVLVVVLTVHEDDDSVFKAICAGAAGYLLKPATSSEILAGIETVLAGGSPMNSFIARRVLAMFNRVARPTAAYGLTERERQILQLAVEGCTKRTIASRLSLSPHTVDSHLRSIYGRLQVHSRGSAVAKAVRERLV